MKKFNVYLSLKYTEPNKDENYIVLVRSENSFNDFGTKGYFDIYIKYKVKEVLCLKESFKLIFEESFSQLLTDELKNSTDIASQFIGQIQNEKYYRKIMYYFNHNITNVIKVLFSIHDAAIIREKEITDYDLLINSNEFNEVLLRDSGAYYAYSKGIYILYRNEKELDVSKVFSSKVNFEINSALTSYSVSLDYTKSKYFPSNLNIFVGQNSSGKSYTIKEIINILFGKETIYQKKFDEEVPAFNRIVLFSNTINDNYLATKNDVKDKLNLKSEYHYINLINKKKFDLQFGVRRNFTTSHALHDILFRDWHEASFFSKWKTVVDSLKKIINHTTVMIPIIGEGYRELNIPTSEQRMLNYLNKIDKKRDLEFYKDGKIIELSSGQHTFVRFIFYTLALIEQNSLIIIDEPENFMHPNYEIEFVKIINNLLKSTKSIGLIATHSSVFVREIPAKHVHKFSRDKDGIFVTKPNIETFVNNLHKISSYIFGDLAKDKKYEEILENMVGNNTDPLELIHSLSEDIDTDILSILVSKYMKKNVSS